MGNHQSGTFKDTPAVMKYVKAPFDIATFLEAAQHTGSNLLQYGGYSIPNGVDCQTFTIMVLMRLGLPQLVDIVVGSYMNNGGLLGRYIPNGAPAGVHTCNPVGNGGELAGYYYINCGIFSRLVCYSPVLLIM